MAHPIAEFKFFSTVLLCPMQEEVDQQDRCGGGHVQGQGIDRSLSDAAAPSRARRLSTFGLGAL